MIKIYNQSSCLELSFFYLLFTLFLCWGSGEGFGQWAYSIHLVGLAQRLLKILLGHPIFMMKSSSLIFLSLKKDILHEAHSKVLTSMDWKIGKCRRYFGEISVIGRHRNDNRHRLSIDGKIGQKSAKSPIYRRNIGGGPKNRRNIGEWSHARRRRQRTAKNRRLIGKIGDKSPIFSKNRRFFADKIAINRRFFEKIGDFFEDSRLLIWRPILNFWGSDGLDFTRVCKGLQRSDLWSNGGKSIFTLSKGYGVFPTVIWRSNGEIWIKFWFNG